MAPRSSSHWRLLASLLRSQRRLVAALALALAAGSALPLVGPQLLRAFIDRAIAGAGASALAGIAAVYVLLGVTAQAVAVVTSYSANKVAWTSTNALRERAAAHVLSLDLGFHRGTRPGTLIERVDGDTNAIAKFFTDFVLKVVGGGLTLVGVVVLTAREDWRVGLALALFSVLAVGLILRMRDVAVPANAAARASYAGVLGVVEERLAGAEDLRALGGGGHALRRLVDASARQLRDTVRGERANALIWCGTGGLFAIGTIGMLIGAYVLHRGGAITVGTVFLLFQYTQVLRQPVEQISEQLQQVQRAAAGASRIAELLDTRSALAPGGPRRLPDGALEIRFRGLSYAYPDDRVPVLRDIDLAVPAGTSLGLVGRTGSGKTTLARLALRLVDPTAGAVVVGGVDLREVRDGDLRARLAIVTQDVQLFRASVRDNLTLFGAVPAADTALESVLDEVGLGAWLASLAAGLDAQLGVGGAGLSAGQAQLLGLARVFLRDPGLVVLDEASSRADPATQELVDQATARLLARRTGVIIAHRLDSVLRADAVAVLDAGRVLEHGPTGRLAGDPGSALGRLLRLDGREVSVP